jgi:restriction system protein
MNLIQPLRYRFNTEILGNLSNNTSALSAHTIRLWQSKTCPYCETVLTEDRSVHESEYCGEEFFCCARCPKCNWWRSSDAPAHYSIGYCHVGILHRTHIESGLSFDPALEAIEINAQRLFSLTPRAFEEFVGSLFREYFDCKVVHVGKSHDGGIDLILLDSNRGILPVQVKRRTNPSHVESVSLIREFRGAMLLQGMSQGMIVSTADHFSRSAREAADPKPEHLAPQSVDLINCRRLLDILDAVVVGGGDAKKPQNG